MLCPFKFNRARIIKEDSLCEEKNCAFYIIDGEQKTVNAFTVFDIDEGESVVSGVLGHCCVKDLGELRKLILGI